MNGGSKWINFLATAQIYILQRTIHSAIFCFSKIWAKLSVVSFHHHFYLKNANLTVHYTSLEHTFLVDGLNSLLSQPKNGWNVLIFLLFCNALDLNNQTILCLPSIHQFERKLGFWTTLTQCQIGLLFFPLHYFHSFSDRLAQWNLLLIVKVK